MNERTRRNAVLAGAVVLGLASIAAGALIAVSDGDERASTTPSASPTRSESPSPTPTQEPAASPEPSPTPARIVLEDGRHLVYVTDAARRGDGSARVTFDLTSFHTGEEAEEIAAEHGDEAVNGYYVENDNPRLRRIPVAADAVVRYVPVGSGTTELVPGTLDAWLEAVMETNQTDYAGKDVPWWFTVADGIVTRIEQQYLP